MNQGMNNTDIQLNVDHYGDKVDDPDDIQGKIFIGGLSWQTTEQTLRFYFEKFGELADVALMVDKRTGKPRGFGFIKMKDPAAADIIMSNEHTIDGRLVDVKRALPRDKAPGPARSEACKIFVGGLSSEVSEKEFGDYFSKYGAVKDAVVMVDRNTGSSRGFGFITFEKEDTVDKVMNLEHEIKGKFVEIKRAEPREASRGNQMYDGGMYGGQSMQMSGGGGGRGGGRGGGGYGGNGGGGGGGRYGGGGGRGGPDPYGGGGGYGNYGGGGGMRGYPTAGYGGPPPGGYRGGAAAYGMPGVAGYGYPAAAAPMGGPAMSYYGGGVPATAGGYPAAYGATSAATTTGTMSAPTGYGNVGYGAASTTRPDASGQYTGQVNGDYQSNDNAQKGYDSAIAGYTNAVRAQQQPQYAAYSQAAGGGGAVQGAVQGGYGGGSYGYGGNATGGAPSSGPGGARNLSSGAEGGQGGNSGYGGGDSSGSGGGYGSYRSQGAAQGRADRSYRPY